MCANLCNFGLSNFEKNGLLQLIVLCNFMLKGARVKWLSYKLQIFAYFCLSVVTSGLFTGH